VTALRRAVFAAFILGLGVSITLSEATLAGLVLLWLWRLRDPAVRRPDAFPLWRPAFAFAAATVLSALLAEHTAESLLASKGLLLILVLYVTADALADAPAAERFLSALAVIAAVAAAVGLLQVALCPSPEPSGGWPAWLSHRCARARGFFSIYMTLAGVLTLVLLATLPRLLPGGGGRAWLGAPWLTMLLGLVATYTRGAWLGFAAGVLALVPGTRRGRWLLPGGLLLLVLLTAAAPPGLRHRVLTMADPQEAGIRERVYMWRSGLAMWGERPLTGVGPGGVSRAYPGYALPEAVKKRTSHVHNTPLQILVERGLLGLACWLWIWAAFYARALAVLRRLGPGAARERALVSGSLAAVTGFLVAGLSEYNFGDSEVAMVAWAIMALPFVVEKGLERAPAHRP
jgi:O-antigen ligase